MKIWLPAGVRRDWIDRNVLSKTQAYAVGGVAPHALTQRFAYTVPAGRLAIISSASIIINRATAAGTAGLVNDIITIDDGGGQVGILYCNLYSNGVGDRSMLSISPQLPIKAGWTVAGLSGDSSTGGSVLHDLTVSITEFDA